MVWFNPLMFRLEDVNSQKDKIKKGGDVKDQVVHAYL